MAKTIHQLNARRVATETSPGIYADGGNLYLIVKKNKQGGVSKRWAYIFQFNGKRCEMGLGSAQTVSLAQARALAEAARHQTAADINPIEARRLKRAEGVTFGEFAPGLVNKLKPQWKNAKHIYQWERSINVEAASLHPLPLNKITATHVLAVLNPIWAVKPETAMRTRQRIETVLNSAKALGLRDGDNPARWSGGLEHSLPKRQRHQRQHHAALPIAKTPPFMIMLAGRQALAARALELTILTAARTGEIIGARWSEFDLQSAIWTVPAERMKAGIEHRVPLSDQAIDLLKELKAKVGANAEFVFSNPGTKRVLTNAAMIELLKRMKMTEITVHGFRSTFRDWAGDMTDFAWEVMEAALAHRVGTNVQLAYRRGDALEKRRELMQAWADYCLPLPQSLTLLAA